MEVRFSLSIAALAAGLSACAGAPNTVDIADAQAAGQTCKLVQSGDDPEGTVVCGDAAQWAEFDRRAAILNSGVICRWAPLSAERLCMTEAQWESYERQIRNLAETRRGGAIASSGANFGVPMVTGLMAEPRSN